MSDQVSFMGGCLCGAVRYEAVGEPVNALLCHCKMCQRASGAPVTALLFMETVNVKVTKGQTRVVPFSPRVSRQVCDVCAAPLFFSRHARPDRQAIFVGSLDDPSGFKPRLQVCTSSAMGWLDVRNDIPRYDEKPEEMTPTLSYDPVSGETSERPRLARNSDFDAIHREAPRCASPPYTPDGPIAVALAWLAFYTIVIFQELAGFGR